MSSMAALAKIVELLTPLAPEERTRIVHAALVMLGEPIPAPKAAAAVENSDDSLDDLSARARVWMRQNAISTEQLQQVFHLADGTVEVIAGQLPGRNKKDQTYSAYLLTGVGQLLLNGNPAFDDKAARALCEAAGCYDSSNHSAILKDRGNEFTGSKDRGWTLTAPGLKRAADLIKDASKLNA